MEKAHSSYLRIGPSTCGRVRVIGRVGRTGAAALFARHICGDGDYKYKCGLRVSRSRLKDAHRHERENGVVVMLVEIAKRGIVRIAGGVGSRKP
jgi:hypothetical protein